MFGRCRRGAIAPGLAVVVSALLFAGTANGQGDLAPTLGAAQQIDEAFDPGTGTSRKRFERFDLNAPDFSGAIERVSEHVLRSGVVVDTALEPGQARYVQLSPTEETQLTIAVRREVVLTAGAKAIVFPGLVETVDSAGGQVSLKAIAIPGEPLRYNDMSDEFEGEMHVGVVEVGPLGVIKQTKKLSAPVSFQVLGAVWTDPKLVQVSTTAPPYQRLVVGARVPSGDTDVTVVSNVTPEGEAMTLRVQPKLVVKVSPRDLQGWGFETGDVLVSARGGRPAERAPIQLTSELGRLADTQLNLVEGGTARTTIRSVSLMKTSVHASGAGFDDGSARVIFEFPWRFLLAGLLGGLVGIVLRRGETRPLGARIVVGLASAALVLGLYLLGVDVTGFSLPANGGELLVFVVAALGAFFGTRLLRPGAGL